MNLIFILFTGFVVGLSGAMIPGPLTIYTVSQSLSADKYAGLKIISGHIIIEFILMSVLFLGFHKLFTLNVFLVVISIIGGLALIIMGVILLSNIKNMKLSDIEKETKSKKNLIIGGIVFSIVSPGFFIWWGTIGFLTVVRAAVFGVGGIAILILGHWLADIIWYGSLSYMINKGKLYLSDSLYKNTMKILSLLLIIMGIYFLIPYK